MRTFAYKQEVATMPVGTGQIFFNPQQTIADHVSMVIVSIQPVGAATNQDVGRFQRFQISAGGVPIFTWTMNQLRAYVQRFSKSNWVPPITGAGSDTLTIPFCFLDAPTIEEQDACQFPLGAGMSFSIQYGANGGSGNPATGDARVMLSYVIADRDPEFFPVMLTDQMNIQPGPVNGTGPGVYPLVEPGDLRAILTPTVGIAELRLQLNAKLLMQLPGPANLSAAANALRESQQMANGAVTFEPLCIATPFHRSAGYERSFLALDVANNWAGPANELGIYAVRTAGTPLTAGRA